MDEKQYNNNLKSTFFSTLSNDMMKEIRNQYLYVRNDYLMEFCWWNNINDSTIIKTELKEGDKEGTKDSEFKRFEISEFTYLDRLWCLWEILRSYEKIFVRNKDIYRRKVTIDPCENLVKFNLIENETEGIEKLQYSKIFANSFGPFNSLKYFNSEFRLLWLLKESFLTPNDFLLHINENHVNEEKKLGRHDQAKEYYDEDWKTLSSYDGNPTIANVVKLSSIILGEIFDGKEGKIKAWNKDTNPGTTEWMREIMDHICILEVNHFPGLAFVGTDSNDTLINKWTNMNKLMLCDLINFIDPDLVIGGGDDILNCFCNGNFFHWCSEYEFETLTYDKKYEYYKPFRVLGEEVYKNWTRDKNIGSKHCLVLTKKNTYKNKDNDNLWRYWINADHPSPRNDVRNIPNLEKFMEIISKNIL